MLCYDTTTVVVLLTTCTTAVVRLLCNTDGRELCVYEQSSTRTVVVCAAQEARTLHF